MAMRVPQARYQLSTGADFKGDFGIITAFLGRVPILIKARLGRAPEYTCPVY
jgi:hypothetical protein